MDTAQLHRPSNTNQAPTEERLDSWKEIASYLRRSVRTVHRWEKDEGLPVHRQLHKELGSVFAYKRELDAWMLTRSTPGELEQKTSASPWLLWSIPIAAFTLISAVLFIAATRSVAFRQSHLPEHTAPVVSLELVSALADSQRWPSLSPDGRHVAFVREAAGTPQIWVRDVGGGDPIQITVGQLPALRPQWSASGDGIIYSIRGDGIWSVASRPGESRRIVEHGWNAALSFDGKWLVFERFGQILVATVDGRAIRPLSNVPVEPYYGDAWPTFSPDGKWIAVFLGEEGRFGDYWILPVGDGTARRLTNDFAEGGAPTWTPDGKFVVFPSARAGSMNLWRVAIAGGGPEPLTTGPGDDLDPRLAPDGRSLVFTSVRRTWTVSVLDLKSHVQRTLVEQRMPLAYPIFSRDGRRIAFQGKTSSGDMHLAVIDADGSNRTAVTRTAGERNIMPHWGGDGSSLYFYQVRPRRAFRRISLSAGISQDIAPWSWSRQPFADVDGSERMAVHSVIERGQLRESRLRDLSNGKETALPFALYLNRYSRDGRWIAGESREGEAVVCDVSSGRCRMLTPKDEHGLAAVAWSGDGSRLFLLRHTTAQVFGELASVGVDTGMVTSHGPIGPFQHRYLMSMDASARDEVVFTLCREGPHELWRATLR